MTMDYVNYDETPVRAHAVQRHQQHYFWGISIVALILLLCVRAAEEQRARFGIEIKVVLLLLIFTVQSRKFPQRRASQQLM